MLIINLLSHVNHQKKFKFILTVIHLLPAICFLSLLFAMRLFGLVLEVQIKIELRKFVCNLSIFLSLIKLKIKMYFFFHNEKKSLFCRKQYSSSKSPQKFNSSFNNKLDLLIPAVHENEFVSATGFTALFIFGFCFSLNHTFCVYGIMCGCSCWLMDTRLLMMSVRSA